MPTIPNQNLLININVASAPKIGEVIYFIREADFFFKERITLEEGEYISWRLYTHPDGIARPVGLESYGVDMTINSKNEHRRVAVGTNIVTHNPVQPHREIYSDSVDGDGFAPFVNHLFGCCRGVIKVKTAA